MKRKSQKPSRLPLDQLVEYLNWDVDKNPSLQSTIDPDWNRKAKAVQDELRADVQKLLHPPPIPADARANLFATSPGEFWLRTVVDRIDAIDFYSFFHVDRWPHLLYSSNRSVLRLGNENFIVLHVPSESDDLGAPIYWTLGETLRSGEFSMLRRCLECSKYFITTRSNKQTHNRKCSTNYQNRIRIANGKLKEYRDKTKKRLKKDKDLQIQQKAADLYQDTVYGDLSKTDRVMYNQIQREVGGGDDAKGHREIARWDKIRRSFNEINDHNQAIFIKYAMEPRGSESW